MIEPRIEGGMVQNWAEIRQHAMLHDATWANTEDMANANGMWFLERLKFVCAVLLYKTQEQHALLLEHAERCGNHGQN